MNFKKEHYKCPIEATLNLVGNKWKGAILYYLLKGPKRFHELQQCIQHATTRMLTLQLRALEKDKILIRKIDGTKAPYKVEYSLSELGYETKALIDKMDEFGKKILKSKLESS